MIERQLRRLMTVARCFFRVEPARIQILSRGRSRLRLAAQLASLATSSASKPARQICSSQLSGVLVLAPSEFECATCLYFRFHELGGGAEQL